MTESREHTQAPRLFKDHFDHAMVTDLARRLQVVDPAFPAEAFCAAVIPQLAPLELKGRVAAIAAGLQAHLPPAYPEAITRLLAILGPPHNESEGMFKDGWDLMPVAAFVEYYGLEHLDESLAAMHAITQRHTAEFAIRPFLQRYPAATLATLQQWVSDPSFHVRRLVSEGTRTRLPWACQLPALIADPSPVLPLLAALRDDPTAYVRRSVANNLNDLAKDHPELVLATLERWQHGATPERQGLIRHALRTLIKQGHPAALRLLGAEPAAVILETLAVTPTVVTIGSSLTITVGLRSNASTPQQLIIDYVLCMPGVRETIRRKVFKLRTQRLEPGATLRLVKRHSFAPVTVRAIYPGQYRIELQVNGQIVGDAAFDLVAPNEN
ncbi:MAG: DNA alkylation repair protein [Oscillochloridaceae bacterium umkhey_bin13]